ncbi:hypothetical protein GCM10027566_05980 [Arachidicoccus ginsenosidivorans]|uniref:DUF262 domain-containing protein n=2 Tax=Arachidicoccus ginsenosidivorans TaxID=496057 RepID=A0A5B8VR15_9BACT|nr:DUF262 domain-containing protein [Arachidicoccus ginsenosidivorans]
MIFRKLDDSCIVINFPFDMSRLIESILLRIPLPPFYFDASDDNKWLVVEGLQRLWSIRNFIINSERKNENGIEAPLELNGQEILTEYNNKHITFDMLNKTMQRRILETQSRFTLFYRGRLKLLNIMFLNESILEDWA